MKLYKKVSKFFECRPRVAVGVFFVLLISNVLFFVTLFITKQEINQTINAYPYIDLSRNFIAQEHYLVNIQPLRDSLREQAKEFEATGRKVSIYVEFLNTGGNISINPETYVWPASLSKVPLALAVMKKVQSGEWKLDNKLVVMPGDSDNKSGDKEHPLSDYPIGTRFTIQELLQEMLSKSDNTAYAMFLRNISQDELRNVIQGLGMESLFTQEGRISAKEYSRVLRALYTASYLSRQNSELLLSWLDESVFNEFSTKDIPPEVPFPHKYGEYIPLNAYSDSGIGYIEHRPYIISIMVQGIEGAPYEQERAIAGTFMSRVSRDTYEYFLNAKNSE